MKKLIPHALVWSIIGLVLGWVLWPFELDFLLAYCKGINPEVQFNTTNMNGPFMLGLKNAFSWLALAWIAFITHWAINKYKLVAWSIKQFYTIFAFVLVGYVCFAGLCLLVLKFSIQNANDFSISPLIKNDFTINVPNVNVWGIWGAIIFCGMYFVFMKKQQV